MIIKVTATENIENIYIFLKIKNQQIFDQKKKNQQILI